ncbi:MAG: ISL3 family transposase [Syntrophobacteria bacterium]|jgi:transposase
MRDTDLYRHLLGVEDPWFVSEVQLDVKEQRVDVWIEHPKGLQWPCPECGAEGTLHDHAEERVWRHLDSCQFQTFLHARPPRVVCPEHGVRQVQLPWAKPHARFTLLFERFAIEVLRHTTIQAGRMILRISWDEAWHVMERAVQRGLRRKPERMIAQLGVDEKSVGSGQDYVTVVCDLERSTVEEVTEGNNCRSLQIYFEGLTDKQREGIEAVAMDMAGGYINAVSGSLPEGREKIVFDRFHIMKLMNEAVDRVRREEHKRLTDGGSSILTGTKFLWLYARERLPAKHWEQFSILKAAGLKTARAWAIKETLRELWRYKSRAWAEKFWKRWYFWATHSRLAPVKKIANTLKTHLYGILTYSKHRITNATTEGINSKIETLRKAACGFRNKQRFRTVILFHLGGLDLYPATH